MGTELSMQPTRSETGENGMTIIEKKTKGGLAAGVYRMGIPFFLHLLLRGVSSIGGLKQQLGRIRIKKRMIFYYATNRSRAEFLFPRRWSLQHMGC